MKSYYGIYDFDRYEPIFDGDYSTFEEFCSAVIDSEIIEKFEFETEQKYYDLINRDGDTLFDGHYYSLEIFFEDAKQFVQDSIDAGTIDKHGNVVVDGPFSQ